MRLYVELLTALATCKAIYFVMLCWTASTWHIAWNAGTFKRCKGGRNGLRHDRKRTTALFRRLRVGASNETAIRTGGAVPQTLASALHHWPHHVTSNVCNAAADKLQNTAIDHSLQPCDITQVLQAATGRYCSNDNQVALIKTIVFSATCFSYVLSF